MHGRPAFSIRVKLLASFGVSLLLMLALGAFAISRLGTENAHVNRLASKVVPATQGVGDAIALMNKYRKDQMHYILALPADRPGADGVSGDLAGDLTDMSATLKDYRANGLVADAKDGKLVAAFEAAFNDYVTKTNGFRALADKGQTQASGDVLGSGPGDKAYDVLKAAAKDWSAYKATVAAAAAKSSRSSYDSSKALIIGLLIAAIAIATGIALLISRGLTRNIRKVGDAANAIAKGDVNQHVEVSSGDELGVMADDFNEMVDYLKTTVSVAETIADGDLSRDPQPRSSAMRLDRRS